MVLICKGGGWLQDECQRINVRFIDNVFFGNSIYPFRAIKAMRFINNIVKEFQPDLVHCHSSVAGFLCRLAVKNSVPTIFTAHGWAFDKGTPILRRIIAIAGEKIAAKYCKKIICVSEFTKHSAMCYGIAAADKLVVIYNGVKSIGRLVNNMTDNRETKMVFAGRFSKQKNPILLLKSLLSLDDIHKRSINLTLIGSGPDRKKITKYIKSHSDALPNIDIVDNISPSEIHEYLFKMDIFILISNWEGFPYTILEAMSCGLPVIASNVGGVSEAVDSSCGILVNNNTGQISEAILSLVNDKELRLKMGERAREIISQKFSLEKMLKEIEGVYNE